MTINAAQLRATVAMVLNWIGLFLACVVIAKLAGAGIRIIPGSVEALALAAIACSVAR